MESLGCEPGEEPSATRGLSAVGDSVDHGRREQLLLNRRLTSRAKLDLKDRLDAANLGSLLFEYGPPPALGRVSARPGSSRPATVRSSVTRARQKAERSTCDSQVVDGNLSRPETARLSTRQDDRLPWGWGGGVRGDGKRRPLSARPAHASVTGQHRSAARQLTADVTTTQAQATLSQPVRVWSMDAAAPCTDAGRIGTGSHRASSTDSFSTPSGCQRLLGAPVDVLRAQRDGLADELKMLRCGVTFNCQPDFRWKDVFKAAALDLQEVARFEHEYTQRMRSYRGRQTSKARVVLNTPRDQPDKARVLPDPPTAPSAITYKWGCH